MAFHVVSFFGNLQGRLYTLVIFCFSFRMVLLGPFVFSAEHVFYMDDFVFVERIGFEFDIVYLLNRCFHVPAEPLSHQDDPDAVPINAGIVSKFALNQQVEVRLVSFQPIEIEKSLGEHFLVFLPFVLDYHRTVVLVDSNGIHASSVGRILLGQKAYPENLFKIVRKKITQLELVSEPIEEKRYLNGFGSLNSIYWHIGL